MDSIDEYRAWSATLSLPDKKAYDALVKQENPQRREEWSKSMSDMMRRELSCRSEQNPGGYYGETIQVCDD